MITCLRNELLFPAFVRFLSSLLSLHHYDSDFALLFFHASDFPLVDSHRMTRRIIRHYCVSSRYIHIVHIHSLLNSRICCKHTLV
jgi:hypothetical protein